MKTTYFLLISLITFFLACDNSSNRIIDNTGNKPDVVIKELSIAEVDFRVIEMNDHFVRIELTKKTDTTTLRQAVDLMNINSKLIYFNTKDKPGSGNEFASIISDMILIIDPEISLEIISQKMGQIKKFDGSIYRNSIPMILEELDVFKNYIKFLDEAKSKNDQSLKQKLVQLESIIRNLQVKEFPKMRSAYASISKATLWENDIDVKYSGSTITYIGGIFAANRNKIEFHKSLHSVLHDLRFKQIRFKWYELDDTYTYYTIDSPKDSELIR